MWGGWGGDYTFQMLSSGSEWGYASLYFSINILWKCLCFCKVTVQHRMH